MEVDVFAGGFANNTSFSIFGGVIKIMCIALALFGLGVELILKGIATGIGWFGLVMVCLQGDGGESQEENK